MDFSREIATILIAAVPVTELRAAVPLALTKFHLPVFSALFFSVLGGLLPIPFVYFCLRPLVDFVEEKIPWVHRHLIGFLEKKHAHFQSLYDKFGALALGLFVAVTIPPTGVWSATVLMVLLRVRPRFGLPAIIVGEIISGLIVILIVKGWLGFLGWLL
jgi:uncharacterized membrane protein